MEFKLSSLIFKLILYSFLITRTSSSPTTNLVKENFPLAIFSNHLFPIPRIIGGTDAQERQFPWHVILKRYELDQLYCGGSIISENLILTAAHCLDGFDSMFIAYGTIKLNDIHSELIKSDLLITHPLYNPKNLNHDIGLIKLSKSIKFNDKVQKIDLISYEEAENSFSGEISYVTGFGYTSDNWPEFSNTLLYTKMEVITNEECRQYYNDDIVISSTLCAKGENNQIKNICAGDSGGAMVLQRNNKFIQIGINSFVTNQGCSEGLPSGFVRVGSYLDFINQYLHSSILERVKIKN